MFFSMFKKNDEVQLSPHTDVYYKQSCSKEVQTISQGVCAVVLKSSVKKKDKGWELLDLSTLEEQVSFVWEKNYKDKRFKDEQTIPYAKGTGSAIAEHLILASASTFFENGKLKKLTDYCFVFGFKKNESGKVGHVVKHVYFPKFDKPKSCKFFNASKKSSYYGRNQNWIVIETSEKMLVPRIKLHNFGGIALKTNVYCLTHFMGNPIKFFHKVRVDKVNYQFFRTALDSVEGYLGSPVFSQTTNRCLGIISKGNLKLGDGDETGIYLNKARDNTGVQRIQTIPLEILGDDIRITTAVKYIGDKIKGKVEEKKKIAKEFGYPMTLERTIKFFNKPDYSMFSSSDIKNCSVFFSKIKNLKSKEDKNILIGLQGKEKAAYTNLALWMDGSGFMSKIKEEDRFKKIEQVLGCLAYTSGNDIPYAFLDGHADIIKNLLLYEIVGGTQTEEGVIFIDTPLKKTLFLALQEYKVDKDKLLLALVTKLDAVLKDSVKKKILLSTLDEHIYNVLEYIPCNSDQKLVKASQNLVWNLVERHIKTSDCFVDIDLEKTQVHEFTIRAYKKFLSLCKNLKPSEKLESKNYQKARKEVLKYYSKDPKSLVDLCENVLKEKGKECIKALKELAEKYQKEKGKDYIQTLEKLATAYEGQKTWEDAAAIYSKLISIEEEKKKQSGQYLTYLEKLASCYGKTKNIYKHIEVLEKLAQGAQKQRKWLICKKTYEKLIAIEAIKKRKDDYFTYFRKLLIIYKMFWSEEANNSKQVSKDHLIEHMKLSQSLVDNCIKEGRWDVLIAACKELLDIYEHRFIGNGIQIPKVLGKKSKWSWKCNWQLNKSEEKEKWKEGYLAGLGQLVLAYRKYLKGMDSSPYSSVLKKLEKEGKSKVYTRLLQIHNQVENGEEKIKNKIGNLIRKAKVENAVDEMIDLGVLDLVVDTKKKLSKEEVLEKIKLKQDYHKKKWVLLLRQWIMMYYFNVPLESITKKNILEQRELVDEFSKDLLLKNSELLLINKGFAVFLEKKQKMKGVYLAYLEKFTLLSESMSKGGNSAYIEALKDMAQLFYEQKKWAQAVSSVEQLIKKQKKVNADLSFYRTASYLQMGLLDQSVLAVKDLELAYKKINGDDIKGIQRLASVYDWLVGLYSTKNKPNDALDYGKKSVQYYQKLLKILENQKHLQGIIETVETLSDICSEQVDLCGKINQFKQQSLFLKQAIDYQKRATNLYYSCVTNVQDKKNNMQGAIPFEFYARTPHSTEKLAMKFYKLAKLYRRQKSSKEESDYLLRALVFHIQLSNLAIERCKEEDAYIIQMMQITAGIYSRLAELAVELQVPGLSIELKESDIVKMKSEKLDEYWFRDYAIKYYQMFLKLLEIEKEKQTDKIVHTLEALGQLYKRQKEMEERPGRSTEFLNEAFLKVEKKLKKYKN